MATRVFINATGVIGVERNSVLVFGSPKVLRAVDVTIQNRPTQDLVVLALRHPVTSKLLAETGASSTAVTADGHTVFVFPDGSGQTEATVRAVVDAHVPDKTAKELARERIEAWRANELAPVDRQIIEDLIDVIYG